MNGTVVARKMTFMDKKKAKADRATDRHKPRRMVGLPERVAAALEEYGQEKEAGLSETVKIACIEFLERIGRWPPKKA